MINVDNILDAAATLLEGNADFISYVDPRWIEVAEFVNADPSIAAGGWVGIFRGDIEYTPLTLGNGANNWSAQLPIIFFVQYCDFHSGRAAETWLNAVTNYLNRALISDKTLSGNVDRLTRIREEPSFQNTESESMYFQNRVITATYEVIPDE